MNPASGAWPSRPDLSRAPCSPWPPIMAWPSPPCPATTSRWKSCSIACWPRRTMPEAPDASTSRLGPVLLHYRPWHGELEGDGAAATVLFLLAQAFIFTLACLAGEWPTVRLLLLAT